MYCTIYNICTLCGMYCTIYNICTLCGMYCTIYNICTLCGMYCTIYNICTLCDRGMYCMLEELNNVAGHSARMMVTRITQ